MTLLLLRYRAGNFTPEEPLPPFKLRRDDRSQDFSVCNGQSVQGRLSLSHVIDSVDGCVTEAAVNSFLGLQAALRRVVPYTPRQDHTPGLVTHYFDRVRVWDGKGKNERMITIEDGGLFYPVFYADGTVEQKDAYCQVLDDMERTKYAWYREQAAAGVK